MAALGCSASNQSLFDFFDDKPKRRKSSPNNSVMVDHIEKFDDVLNNKTTDSSTEGDVSCGQNVICIPTMQNESSEHEMEKEQLQQSDIESGTSNSPESRSLCRGNSECYYSTDFSSCPSSPKIDDSRGSSEHIKREDEKEDLKMVMYNKELTDEIVKSIDNNRKANTKSRQTASRNSPYSVSQVPSQDESQSRISIRTNTPIDQTYQNPGRISRRTTTPIDQSNEIQGPGRESRTKTPIDQIYGRQDSISRIKTPVNQSHERQGRISRGTSKTPLDQSHRRQDRISRTRTHSELSLKDAVKVIEEPATLLETLSKNSNETKTEMVCKESISPMKGEGEGNDYSFVEKEHVTKKEENTEKERKESKTELKNVRINIDMKKQSQITNPKLVKNRKSHAELKKGAKNYLSCNMRESGLKSAPLFGKTPPSINNNSKSKRKHFCKNCLSETSGTESHSEGNVGILKMDSNSDTKNEFGSSSDQLLIGSSSSGCSFGSRYTTSTFQNSPYNGGRYSNVSKCNYQSGRFSLPSINKTVPGQLVRTRKSSLKRSSDSDVSTSLIARKQSVQKSLRTKITEANTCKPAKQKIGDYRKPKIPIQLRAEAMLRDGQLEVSVTDKEDVEIGTNNLNVKLTVVHKFIEQKPRQVIKLPQKATRKVNRDVVNQRAMWPSFNTYTNREASERYYNCFRY